MYVIAVLGTSPAILTELMWWLVVREGKSVLGLEVWTTASISGGPSGVQSLEKFLRDGRYGELKDALGVNAMHVPDPPAIPLRPVAADRLERVADSPLEARPFRVVYFSRKGEPIRGLRRPMRGVPSPSSGRVAKSSSPRRGLGQRRLRDAAEETGEKSRQTLPREGD